MATADSVKAKIQGLITAANTKTGNSDADLTTAVNTLIDGFGQGGVELPEIDESVLGSANDLAKGKKLIGADGNVVTGTLTEFTASTNSLAAILNTQIHSKTIGTEEPEKIIDIYAQTQSEGILRKGAWSHARAPLSMFGDATQADVAAGRFFTSKEGFKVVGEQPVPYTDITNMHIWEKYIIHGGKYIETPVNDVMITSYLSSSTVSADTNISYGDKIDVIDGVISFVNEKTVTYNNTNTKNEIISKLSVIKDNFVKTATNNYYFIPEDAVLSISSGDGNVSLTNRVISNIANQITVNDYQPKFVSLVGSPYSTTYPTNGEKDGYEYIYVGNLSDILDSKIITKTGTTTSHVIDTGLSSIEEFVIYKESLNTTGLIHLHYSKNDGTSYLYASAWSTNSWGTKTINNGTTAATVSGGSITLPSSTDTSGGLSSGITYKWTAVGTE